MPRGIIITTSGAYEVNGMEGHVYRKTGFSGYFVRVFTVLEKQRLSFYESLDSETHEYKGFKGTLYLKNGSLETTKDGMRKYCLKICENKLEMKNNEKSELLDCGDPKTCQAWATALNKAFNYHIDQEQKREAPRRFRALLELPEEGEITKAQITKNYKRVCLKNHPDKGGDADMFAEMASAYKSLLALQDEEEKFRGCEVIEYELVLRKGEKGLGFSVVEDKVKNGVYVSDVHDNIHVLGMTAEAEGEILIHDRIIGIDKDDTSEWPISRVRARLNNTRLKKGQQVTFIMERSVHAGNKNDDKTRNSETENHSKENETPNNAGSDPFASTNASPPSAPFTTSSSSPFYQHHYQGGMSPDPHTPFSTTSDTYKSDYLQPEEKETLTEEIKRLKEQLRVANARIEETKQTHTMLNNDTKDVNNFDQMKKNELGKILLQCQRSLSMYIDNNFTDNIDNKLLDLQKSHDTALQIMAFSDEEIMKFVDEQKTNEKFHERIEKIEALIVSTMTKGK